MQTKPKSNSIITHELIGNRTIDFKFRGTSIGQVRLDSMSSQNLERAAIHGMIQRVGDGGAFERLDKTTGLLRTDGEMDTLKRARIETLIAHYNSGTPDWNLVRVAGVGPDNTGLTMEAIARVYFKGDIADTERKVDTLAEKKGIGRKAMLATYGNIPDVAAMIGTIKAERAARTGLDAAGMADELMNA